MVRIVNKSLSVVGNLLYSGHKLYTIKRYPISRLKSEPQKQTIKLVCWHIHFQTNDAGYFFIDKATERGDAVASSIEVNAVQWENRQVN